MVDADCPLTDLPSSHSDYLQCQLHKDRWYQLNYTATLLVELIKDGRYQLTTDRITQIRLFQPQVLTHQGGNSWIKQLTTHSLRFVNNSEFKYKLILLLRLP